MKAFLNQHIQYILTHKKLYAGIAIILIILSHLIHADPLVKIWYVFYPGFIGVDLFMFFGGYGLCRSFETNSLSTFYYHRFKRIYPLYLVFATAICGYTIWHGKSISCLDWICACTSLSYWGCGRVFVDWYLSFLLCLYIIFPILYKFIKRIGNWGVILSLCAIFPILIWGKLPWMYECAFSRIPIFLMGIACAIKPSEQSYTTNSIAFCIAFIVSIFLWWGGWIQKYIVVYMFAPIFMVLLAVIASQCRETSKIYMGICYIGSISLEVYIANMLTNTILLNMSLPYSTVGYYVALQVIFTIILVYINKGVNVLFSKLDKH